MTALREIQAPTRELPRYCPSAPLPRYRFVPGLHPHPTRDPAGHSRGAEDPPQGDWDELEWRDLAPWLRGVDLFNRFYFWEAHEAWESLWRGARRESPPAIMLRGLIQIAAALLKCHMGSPRAAQRLASAGIDKLTHVAQTTPTLMGLDVAATVNEFHTYFRPLAAAVLPEMGTRVPALRLATGRPPAEPRR